MDNNYCNHPPIGTSGGLPYLRWHKAADDAHLAGAARALTDAWRRKVSDLGEIHGKTLEIP